MTVSTIVIISLPDGVVYSEEETVRPVQTVIWTGGTGAFDVLHEWDTVSTFDGVDLITDNNVSVTSPDTGVPPSDLGGSQTWYYRVTITDHGDEVNEIQRVLHDHTGGTFTLSFDGQGPTAAIAWNAIASVVKTSLEALSNITTVNVTESAVGDWLVEFVDPGFQDVAMMTADGTLLTGGTTIDVTEDTKGVAAGTKTEPPSGTHTIIFQLSRVSGRFLHLLKSIIPGFAIGDPDDARETPGFLYLLKSIIPGFAIGEQDDARETAAFLHLNKNITTLQPCPFFDTMAPTLVEVGDAVLLTGDSFGATQATFDTEVRLYSDGPALSGPFVLMTATSWADGLISVTVPAGAATGWVTLVQTNGLATCSSSDFKLLQVLAVPPDPDAGWWLLTADKENAITAAETFIPANPVTTSFKAIMNDIGSGKIELPLGDPQIADFIDPVTRKGVLVRTYLDDRFRYAWYAQRLAHDYNEEGDAIAVVSGPGMEVVAEWAKVLPHDFPASPTKNPTWIYGSTDNLVRNGTFEDNVPILQNPGGEDGNTDDGNPEGWAKRGKNLTSMAAVQDTAEAFEGDWYIEFLASDNHSGIQQSVTVTPGKVYHVRVLVKDPLASAMRVTLALGGADDISALGTTYPNNFKYKGEILAELDNVARNPAKNGLPGGSTDGTWQVMDVEVQTGAEQTSLTIGIQNDHHQTGIFNPIRVDGTEIEGWGLGLDPWTAFDPGQHATSSFRLDSTTTFEGSPWAARINALGRWAGLQQIIQVNPLTKYTSTIWAFTSGALGDDTYKLEMDLNDGSNPATIIAFDQKVLTAGWNQFKVIFTTDAVTEEIIWRFVYSGPNNPPPIRLDSASMVPGEPPSVAGKIMNDLLDKLALDNQLLFLNRTWTNTLDSKGAAWPSPLSMDIDPGESIADVLGRFVALGHEWEIVPVNFAEGGESGFELNLYTGRPFNSESGLGINWVSDPEGPVIHPGDATIGGRVVKTGFNTNRIFAIGDGGTWSRVNQHPWLDADQEAGDPAPHGYLQSFGSIEEIITVSAADSSTISQFAASRLAEEKDKEQQLQLSMQRSSVIRPFLSFGVGDSIFADMPPYNADPLVADGSGGFTRTYPKRVRALTANLAGEGAEVDFDVDINRVLYEDELAWFAAIAQLSERSPADNTGQGTGRSATASGGGSSTVIVGGGVSTEVSVHAHDLRGTDIKNKALTGDVSGSLPGPITVNAIKGNAFEGIIPADIGGDPVLMIYDRGLNVWVGVETDLAGAGGLPLTTKGDIHTFSTSDAELAVGADGKFIIADSAEVTGLKWVGILEADITDLNHDDTAAIHDNVASEISAVAAKAIPVAGDFLLIEDSAAANIKKRITVGTLPFTATGHTHLEADVTDLVHVDADAIHDNVASEISAITEKVTPVSGDFLVIEDSAASNAKKRVQVGNLPTGSASPLTTKGDVYTFDTADARLPVGTNDQVLTADSAAATGLKWAAGGGGGDPLTTKGDVFGFDTDAARVPVGADAQVLTADSAAALGVKWTTPGTEPAALRAERATTVQTLTHNTWTTIIFNSIIREDDTNGHFSLDTATGIITINTAGWYHITGMVDWEGNVTGRRIISFIVDGTLGLGGDEETSMDANEFRHSMGTLSHFTATQTVELRGYQNSGGNLDVDFGPQTSFTIHKVDGVAATGSPSSLRAERVTTGQVITNNSVTTVIYNSLIREDDAFGHFSLDTATGIITINTAGWYSIAAGVMWEGNVTGRRLILVRRDGTDVIVGTDVDNPLIDTWRQNVATTAYFTATQTVEVEVLQSSGGSLNVNVDTSTFLSIQKVEAAAPSGYPDSVVDALHKRPSDETVHADDQEMDGADLSTLLVVSGTGVATQKRGVYNLVYDGTTASDLNAALWPLTPTASPVTMEMSGLFLASNDNFHQVFPVVFSDGVVAASNFVGIWQHRAGSMGWNFGTFTAINGAGGASELMAGGFLMGRMYYRLIWSAVNTFKMQLSLDGVGWTNMDIGNQARTLTPTHFGFGGTSWGATTPGMLSVDYIRITEADLSL